MGDVPVRLAVYDLDRTITRLPTWTPFLLRGACTLAPWRLALLPLVGLFALARAVKLIDRDQLKQTMHRALLGPTLAQDQAALLAGRFARFMLDKHIHPGARAQMAADRAEGRRIVIATAAHEFYARSLATGLGVDDLVATRAGRRGDGRISHRIEGANCYGAEKQAMLQAWLAEQGIDRERAHIRFYSDHPSDEPTFDWADEAVAVNARSRMRALATSRGWRVLDWRSRGAHALPAPMTKRRATR